MAKSALSMAGIEVPISGSESVRWIELHVPRSSSSPSHNTLSFAPLPKDCASVFTIGDPPFSIIWKIHKDRPNTLELLELSADKDFPAAGLRLTFPFALSPFAFVFSNQTSSSSRTYSVFVMTVCGVAYLLKVSNASAYTSASTFPLADLEYLDIQVYGDHGSITSVVGIPGCLFLGRSDGSVSSFRLGSLSPNDHDFASELRDDSGISRLWGFVSGGRTVAAVEDLVVSVVHGRKLIFVLHTDGMLRVWDAFSYSKIVSHNMTVPIHEGSVARSLRLWVGEALDSSIIPLAVLCKFTKEDMINVYGLHCSFGDKTTLSLDSAMQTIPLIEGEVIDIKFTSDKIWILMDNGIISWKLSTVEDSMEAQCYTMQEAFVSDQLFQGSDQASDDLLSIAHSLFSSAKDKIIPHVSSIFLHRLLHPGVHNNAILRAFLLDYNKHWTDSEFESLSIDGLRNEILSLVEYEGAAESSISVFYWWRNFCSRYFLYWCKNNEPYGLFVHSFPGTVGLIRKNSVSLLRAYERFELLVNGSSCELADVVTFLPEISGDEKPIVVKVRKCISGISQQLGKAASAIFYESFIGKPILSSEELLPRLLKILENGYIKSSHVHNFSDISWEKELEKHKNLRKFSIGMILSLSDLSKKAGSWGKVLSIIQCYLKFLVPQKIMQKFDAEALYNIQSSIVVQATSQLAKVMFESAFDILLFLSYLVNIGGQINMLHDDMYRVQFELVPMIHEIISEWLIILFFSTTAVQSYSIEDFSSQLSALQIDSNVNKRSWNKKLGKCDFSLAFLLLLTSQISTGDQSCTSLTSFPGPEIIISSVRSFISWIIFGKTSEESSSLLKRSTELAQILLSNAQYDAVEFLLTIVTVHSRMEKTFGSIQETGYEWYLLQHLQGCCYLAQARCGFGGISKDKKIQEAVRSFFRQFRKDAAKASSGEGSSIALKKFSVEAGLLLSGITGVPDGSMSSAEWKLHYYQWAMQIFEQYGMSEGACQFALAALEQVDETFSLKDDGCSRIPSSESAIAIRGQLWANVFKFSLDLNLLSDAYCAIISNPDEESKFICLRRFIIVLHEQGGTKILCDDQLPFIGLTEKIEQELAWKAERSDILTKPNSYKLLYAFEMQRHNWRKAASYMYQYSVRLRTESTHNDNKDSSLILLERLNGLSAVINALYLVNPAYAWIDPLPVETLQTVHFPCKKARKADQKQLETNSQPESVQSYINIEMIQKEFVLTSAEYLLSLENVRWTNSAMNKPPPDLVDLLVHTNLLDMAFTVILKFWTGSGLRRELERVFAGMTIKCCPSEIGGSLCVGNDFRGNQLLLTPSEDNVAFHGSPEIGLMGRNTTVTGQWENLELYLERYKGVHDRLPVIVAETLLCSDPQIELPLWLVHMLKGVRKDKVLGMTGQESNPAALFQLYVAYGRYTEATNLLLEYIELLASMKPADILNRKKVFAVWFPYTAIEQLWGQLGKQISMGGHKVDQYDKLKKLLHGALANHLKLLKVDSDDAVAYVVG